MVVMLVMNVERAKSAALCTRTGILVAAMGRIG